MNEDDAFFWERLQDMPDIEAVGELSLRRTRLVERKRELIAYWDGRYAKKDHKDSAELAGIDLTLTKVNEEIKMRNRRMDNASWRNAVRAVLGDDAYNLCREWVIINERG